MKKTRVTLAVALLVFGVVYLVFAVSRAEGIVYKKVREIRAENAARDAGRSYRLTGNVLAGTIEHRLDKRTVVFTVKDEDGETMPVMYQGTVPDTFKDGAEVVVSGKYDRSADRLEATELLTKCPSKYQGQANPITAAQRKLPPSNASAPSNR